MLFVLIDNKNFFISLLVLVSKKIRVVDKDEYVIRSFLGGDGENLNDLVVGDIMVRELLF